MQISASIVREWGIGNDRGKHGGKNGGGDGKMMEVLIESCLL